MKKNNNKNKTMKKILLATSLLMSMGAYSAQDWSWYPAATSQADSFVQKKELEDKTEITRNVTVSSTDWIDTGGLFECSDWSPDAADMPGGSAFNQDRTCEKHFFKEFTYTAGGAQIHFRVEWKKEPFNQSRSYSGGEQDYIVRSETVSTGWLPDGDYSSCTDWAVPRSSVGNGKPFNQTRTCTVAEKNTTVVYAYWASGAITTESEVIDRRSSEEQETRATTGTGGDSDWIWDRTEYGVWQQDNGSGSLSCGGFDYPTDKTTDFVAYRTCTEPQVRRVYDVYVQFEPFCDDEMIKEGFCSPNGPREKYVELEPEYRSHTVQDSVNVDVVVGNWINDGAKYDCGSWSPAFIPQTYTQFTQTKSCKQNQKRSRRYDVTVRDFSQEDIDDLGYEPENLVETVYSTTDTQTVSVNETRQVYTDKNNEEKYEYANMSTTQARIECARPNATVVSATGGKYRQLFRRSVYDYYLNILYNDYTRDVEYVNYQTSYTTNWSFISKTVWEAPSCTYELDDKCPLC